LCFASAFIHRQAFSDQKSKETTWQQQAALSFKKASVQHARVQGERKKDDRYAANAPAEIFLPPPCESFQ